MVATQLPSGARLIEQLTARHVREGIPQDVVRYSAEATRRHFASWMECPMTARESARVRTYFRSVIRHKAMRSRGRDMLSVRRRFVLASVAEDLRSAGVARERVISELCDFYGPGFDEEEIAQLVDGACVACA